MLARLQSIPSNANEWSSWSMSNYTCLNRIRQAIEAQYGTRLAEYQVEPIPWDSVDSWLAANQQAHQDFNDELGLSGNDLGQVDLRNSEELASWIWLNFFELQGACEKLRIGP